jgi:NAD(P)H-flavin oxidoreductase
MSLKEILEHRRAVRCYDSAQPIDAERVKACIELATLAPSSSNMQLWECYHITDKNLLTAMGKACLSQQSATTAQQLVVFVTRQDLYRKHAQAAVEFELENVRRNSPVEKHDKRSRRWAMYYGMVIPFLYARCFGLLGLVRKALAQCVGLFRPITRQVSESDTRVVVHKSCALAAQTFMLAISEAGYDTCPLEGFDSWRIKRLLHLPCGAEINMVVSCGIRLPKGVWGDRYRQPFDQTYHRI